MAHNGWREMPRRKASAAFPKLEGPGACWAIFQAGRTIEEPLLSPFLLPHSAPATLASNTPSTFSIRNHSLFCFARNTLPPPAYVHTTSTLIPSHLCLNVTFSLRMSCTHCKLQALHLALHFPPSALLFCITFYLFVYCLPLSLYM